MNLLGSSGNSAQLHFYTLKVSYLFNNTIMQMQIKHLNNSHNLKFSKSKTLACPVAMPIVSFELPLSLTHVQISGNS